MCTSVFFGLAKNFQSLVHPFIQGNIFRVNHNCDVFAHTYNMTEVYSHRNRERGSAIDPTEIYQLTPHVHMETISDFEGQRNMTHLLQDRFRVAAKHGWEPQSYVKMLRQWHSIEQV